MQFTRLRLSNFKSFVDATELLIEPGLTGVVGPNGCGKSNLVEALQWVMGEGSARRLRGGDMDDVIFAGTSSRPGKAFASVCLDVTDVDQRVGQTERLERDLEIERRITRGKGSTYRLNGREERARDVQILFADAASGAQSVSLIGQGRIGWLINAKPTERRVLLEEAAGIAGLQGRRREAEAKLNGAEANLVRLEDSQAGLTAQIERLKKQVRAALRYKQLSEIIGQCEAAMLHRAWVDATQRTRAAQAQLVAASEAVEIAGRGLIEIERLRAAAILRLEGVRETALITDRTVAERHAAVAALDAERTRVTAQLFQARQRLQDGEADARREAALAEDAARAIAALGEESAALLQDLERDGAAEKTLAEAQALQGPEVSRLEAAHATAAAERATSAATRDAAKRSLGAVTLRLQQLHLNLERARSQVLELERVQIAPGALAAAEAAVAEAERQQSEAGPASEASIAEAASADAARQAARIALTDVERRCVALDAEIAALSRVLADGGGDGFTPVLEQIGVTPGFEIALAAALGDDLAASLDVSAPRRWEAVDGQAAGPLPAGAIALAEYVTAPAALARRLAAIGIVPDAVTATTLQPRLSPGQRLVTADGSVWRWDGLCVAADAVSPAAIRLAQRNRLTDAQRDRVALQSDFDVARRVEMESAAALERAREREKLTRSAQLQATAAVAESRRAHVALLQAETAAGTKLRAAEQQRDRLLEEASRLETDRAAAEQAMAALPDDADAELALRTLRQQLEQAREQLGQSRRQSGVLERDIAAAKRRIEAIGQERAAWQARAAAATTQAAAQADRRQKLLEEIAVLAERPAVLATARVEAAELLESARRAANDAAAAADTAGREASALEARHAASVQSRADAREALVRCESAIEFAQQTQAAAVRQIADRFSCRPEGLSGVAAFSDELGNLPLAGIEQRLATHRQQREALGPVNLMAESELTALTAELDLIRGESLDLTQAIARLRQAIRDINREGRDRLEQAFTAVDQHFQALFTRLFGGGTARLELSFADGDPLAAGLEILASPPGKKLQMLSLLSGGERALTALALVFAAFLANPAPICVLDEVDAPLDDANVERFCSLVREIAGRTATRFLIVTHHRATMARMDRLFGVTMMERGVSRLVSVELRGAAELRMSA